MHARPDNRAILSRPDMLTVRQFAERFGLPRPLLDKRHAAGKLLALQLEGKRRYRYPAWQGRMVSDEASRRDFEAVLVALGALGAGDPWQVYAFFTTPSAWLDGKTPVASWRHQPVAAILRAAGEWAAAAQSSSTCT